MKNQLDQRKYWRDAREGFCRQEEQQQQTLATIGAGVAIAGTVAGVAIEASKAGHTSGTIPQWGGNFTPINYNPAQGVNDVGAMLYGGTGAGSTSVGLANRLTANQIAERNKVMPGSSSQLAQGSADINSYLRGQIPQDVINQTQRAVAASTGGGYNALSGGGQSPDALARSIGQTSLGIQQMGLSAAPTWQSLANSFVVNPIQIAGLAQNANSQRYNYDALNAQGQLAQATGQFNAGMQTYNAQNMAQQQQLAAGNQMASTIAGAGSSLVGVANGLNNANYLNGLTSPQQGSAAYSNQFGSDMMSSGGFAETPKQVSAYGGIPAYYSGGGQSGYYPSSFSSTPTGG